MKSATIGELRAEMPEKWTPDAVGILGRLESLLAGGLHIGFIERRSGIKEPVLHALLDAEGRAQLGTHEGSGLGGRNYHEEVGHLFRLQCWLDEFAAERLQKARDYTEIPTGLYISGIALEALESKRLFHLIGGYGISKTKTLERFAQSHPMTHETPGVAYFALTDEDRTTTQIYQRISDAIRSHEKFAAHGRSLGQRIRNTLRAGDLLIIDEANYAFERGSWTTLRDIFDGGQASMMLVSNTTSNGFVKSHQNELGAFLSRARTRIVNKNQPDDGERYALALGYTTPAIIEEARKMVSRPGPTGGMRFIAKAFEDAERMASERGQPVDLKILRDAAKMNTVFFR
jgi:DNA transposition AAA+ family ATPase